MIINFFNYLPDFKQSSLPPYSKAGVGLTATVLLVGIVALSKQPNLALKGKRLLLKAVKLHKLKISAFVIAVTCTALFYNRLTKPTALNNKNDSPFTQDFSQSDIISLISSYCTLSEQNQLRAISKDWKQVIGENPKLFVNSLTFLEKILNNARNKPDLRINAAGALGQIRDSYPEKSLATILKCQKEDADLRRFTALSLGNIGSPFSAESLKAVFEKEKKDKSFKYFLACGLGFTGYSKAIDCLIGFMNDTGNDRTLRHDVARALGYIGNNSAVESLSAVIDNPLEEDDILQSIANDALKKIQFCDFTLKEVEKTQGIAYSRANLNDPNKPPNLTYELANELNYLVDKQKGLCLFLLRIEGPDTVDYFKSIFKEDVLFPDLANFENPSSIAFLTNILNNPNLINYSRKEAAEALLMIGNASSIPHLTAIMNSRKDTPEFKIFIAQILARLLKRLNPTHYQS